MTARKNFYMAFKIYMNKSYSNIYQHWKKYDIT